MSGCWFCWFCCFFVLILLSFISLQISALMEKIDPLWTPLHTRFCPVAVFKLVFIVLNWFFLSWALTALLSAELLFPDGLSVDHRADFRCFNGPIVATRLPPRWSSTPDRPPHLQQTCSFSEISYRSWEVISGFKSLISSTSADTFRKPQTPLAVCSLHVPTEIIELCSIVLRYCGEWCGLMSKEYFRWERY